MRLNEWIQISGLDENINAIFETIYNKGYRDGARGRNRVLNSEELDRVSRDLISRVIDGGEGG